ncbi:carbohydrate kinase, PfkB [Pseudomonas psychrotolerans L19]|uniref:ribokinase n=1 Tax=Pseudomonas TaxID=286 RepID=UPI00023A212E|nr:MULTISPECIES: ribokinase [Pseudomonas]EHK70508.1 carbohydrate kinase, PfkB [Pseudomonas psychrotolerans L19]MBA1181848.1 ribokinase [Pseudomonas psychrotolerans]MBA1209920.1 ribokinase [Pseudomonas psychrotolerans]TCQ89716.1 ribokinase [Pseudomonas sp. JUb52]
MGKIAVIGSNMVDLITYIERLPVQGETLEAPDFALGCGGKGANQAVAAAKLGSKVLMLTKVGDDLFADNTLANFRRFGIDTRHVTRAPGRSSGVAPIFVQPDSHNSILIVKGANAALGPADIQAAEADLRDCALIVLQLEIALETVYAAIDCGQRLGIPVLLNPAPAVAELSAAHLARLDYFVPNETELALVSGLPVADRDSAFAAARVLAGRGIRHVVVTLGAAGALYVGEEGEFSLPGQRVAAIDTTGAGDAFIGCFAHGRVQGLGLREAMQRAVAYSALSVTGRGTQTSYPEAAVFEDYLASLDL